MFKKISCSLLAAIILTSSFAGANELPSIRNTREENLKIEFENKVKEDISLRSYIEQSFKEYEERVRQADLLKKEMEKIRKENAKTNRLYSMDYGSECVWDLSGETGGNRGFFSLEPYLLKWSIGTPQRQLHLEDINSYSDSDGFRRYQVGKRRNEEKDHYVIALGSRFGSNIGQVYKLTFANGNEITAVLGDQKADIHTDPTNSYHDPISSSIKGDGSWVEVVVDNDVLYSNKYGKRCWSASKMRNTPFNSEVVRIERLGKSVI